ncbi:hypothetical protein BAY59_24415 [Prauserella coralliicola]|nr:hypothetical protein BAY59_24415 [Prauserella coralliicola]
MLTTARRTIRPTTVEFEICGDFDLTRCADFPADRSPAGRAAEDDPGTLRLAFPLDGTGEHVGALVRQRAPDVVSVEVTATREAVPAVAEQVRRMLSLDVDGTGFADAVAADPVMRTLRERHPGLRPVLFHSPYEAACWAVICARLRVAQAALLKQRLAARLGCAVAVGGRTVASFPSPEQLCALDEQPGLSAQKRQRLVAIAGAAREGLLDAWSLRAMPVEDALERVRGLAGVGPFSAELIVVRGVGHPDVFPRHELRLHTVMAAVYGTGVVEELEDIAQRWQPFRSWGAFLLRSVGTSAITGSRHGGEER